MIPVQIYSNNIRLPQDLTGGPETTSRKPTVQVLSDKGIVSVSGAPVSTVWVVETRMSRVPSHSSLLRSLQSTRSLRKVYGNKIYLLPVTLEGSNLSSTQGPF